MSKSSKMDILAVGNPVKTESLKFRAIKRSSAAYAPVLEKLRELKEGQSFTVTIPERIEARVLQNRLSSAFRNAKIEAPAGCVFMKRVTEDGKHLAISAVAGKSKNKSKKK